MVPDTLAPAAGREPAGIRPQDARFRSTIRKARALPSGGLSAFALARVAAVLALILLAACAQVPTDPAARLAHERANDPVEPANRAVFAGNQWVDRNAVQPVARAYEAHLPDGVRASLRNFAGNLRAPSTLVNDVLQANFDRAWVTTQRFAVNTTVGGAGLFDVASGWDLPGHEADFGQTFGVWGIGPGPAVQLPLFGPSNLRDTAGRVVGFVANPLGFVPGSAMQAVQIAGTGVGVVDTRARLLPMTENLERTSIDHYAALRTISAQRREAFVAEGKAGGMVGRVDIGPMPPPPDAATPAEAR